MGRCFSWQAKQATGQEKSCTSLWHRNKSLVFYFFKSSTKTALKIMGDIWEFKISRNWFNYDLCDKIVHSYGSHGMSGELAYFCTDP